MKIVCVLLFILFFLPSLSLGQETSKPLKGEGIHAFLIRNNRSVQKDYQKFIELNRSKLGKNNVLKAGVEYLLPPKKGEQVTEQTQEVKSSEKKKEPLFGSKYAEYTVTSDRLKGACFFLSSGHGGPDPGAVGKIGNIELHEDEYAYDIMLRLARALMTEGATVHIIIQDAEDGIRDDKYLSNSKRETCMGDAIPSNQTQRLQQRCDKINALSAKAKEKYQRSVFIHLDSRSVEKRIDVFFYHWAGSTNGKRLANTLRQTFQDRYDKHQPQRGFKGTVSARDLYVLGKSKPVGVFTELGNIRNSFDQKRFLEKDNREALANWLRLGLIKDYENYKKNK